MENRSGERRVGRVAVLVAAGGLTAAALALTLGGCKSTPDYPPNLSFPSRADRLVLKLPETAPAAMNVAGELDADLAHLDSEGGKTAEPGSLPQETRTALDRYLRDTFGTPAAPKFGGDAQAQAERLGLTADTHA